MNINVMWYLLPLAFAVSLVYSATRYEHWRFIWSHTVRYMVYVFSLLGATFAFLYLVSLDLPRFWYAPLISLWALLFLRFGRTPDHERAKQKPGTMTTLSNYSNYVIASIVVGIAFWWLELPSHQFFPLLLLTLAAIVGMALLQERPGKTPA